MNTTPSTVRTPSIPLTSDAKAGALPAPRFSAAKDLPGHLQHKVPSSWLNQPLALLRSTDDEGRGTGPGPAIEAFAAGSGDHTAVQRAGSSFEQAIESASARAQSGEQGAQAVLQARSGSYFVVGLQSAGRTQGPLPTTRNTHLSYDTEVAPLHPDLRAVVGAERYVVFDADTPEQY